MSGSDKTSYCIKLLPHYPNFDSLPDFKENTVEMAGGDIDTIFGMAIMPFLCNGTLLF